MKVINRKTPELALFGGRAKTRLYISIEVQRIYFTAALSRLLELQEGLFIHFMNDENHWMFYINDDPDGFKITPVRTKNGFHVTHSGLIKMILSSNGFDTKYAKRAEVKKTERLHDRCPIYELSFEKVSSVLR